MATYQDFALERSSKGTITLVMTPPVAVGGWDVRFTMSKRADGSGLVVKSTSSGFSGTSGIEVVNSGLGQFNITLRPNEVSGLPPGNYAFTLERYTSGFETVLTKGYRMMDY